MIEKVISGGQCGADFAGLKAAKAMGIPTGGWIPYGYLTEAGPNTSLFEEYGILQTNSKSYAVRTEYNVRDSDGTMRFAINWYSPGEICTLKAIKKHNKPYFDVKAEGLFEIDLAKKWIIDNNIKILNVAGNRESTHPGIGSWVEKFLLDLFKGLI